MDSECLDTCIDVRECQTEHEPHSCVFWDEKSREQRNEYKYGCY